jgi:hypothetical protein
LLTVIEVCVVRVRVALSIFHRTLMTDT